VRNNGIEERYKVVLSYEQDILEGGDERKGRFSEIPRLLNLLDRNGEEKEISFKFEGWIGTIVDKENLRGLVIQEGADDDEKEGISINDNRITIFSRDRIGEYDVLPKVQTDTVYDAYVIGEIHVDAFEDDDLSDMAISNRRGYEETDERYRALMEYLGH
jgi:hypothetical protein